jgi:folate-binding protein YgfZ
MFTEYINSRPLTAMESLDKELTLAPKKNYLFDLSYLNMLHVEGERAAEYLQGQLTCDLREVNPSQMRQGAMCNLKGRILALMDVINREQHDLHLILPQDLLLDTRNSLAKTAPFSRVSLRPNTHYELLGFYLQNLDDLCPSDFIKLEPYSVRRQEDGCYYCLNDNFYIFLVSKDNANQMKTIFIDKAQYRGSLAWHKLQLQQKRVDIYPESRGMFLPHRLDLQLKGYLSFNKGCYKGQEIIARTHYRATLKHELKLFIIASEEELKSGQKLMSNGIEVGELVDYCPLGNHQFLIAVSMVFEHPMIVQWGEGKIEVVLHKTTV